MPAGPRVQYPGMGERSRAGYAVRLEWIAAEVRCKQGPKVPALISQACGRLDEAGNRCEIVGHLPLPYECRKSTPATLLTLMLPVRPVPLGLSAPSRARVKLVPRIESLAK